MIFILRYFYCRKTFERLCTSTARSSWGTEIQISKFLMLNEVACRKKYFYHVPLSAASSYKFFDQNKSEKKVLGWLMAFSLTQLLTSKDGDSVEVKKVMNKAKKLLEDGSIDEATKLYNQALQSAITCNDSDHICDIKQQLGMIAFSLENYKDAEKFLSEAKDHLLKKKKTDSLRLSYILLRLAESYQFLNDFEKSEQFYNACADNLKLKIDDALKKKDAETIEFWLMFLESEAHYYLMRGVFEKAQKYFKRAYEISLQTKGEISEHTVMFLQKLGAVAFQNGDLEIAVEYLKQAADSGKHLPGMVSLSNVYVTLGNIYLKQGLLKDAEVMCNQAFKNAKRHQYAKGVEESMACLKELQEALASV